MQRLSRRMRHRGGFGIAVAKVYWNRGVGGALLSKVVEFANENDFDIIELQVRSDNLPAIHLYEKFGFKKLFTYPGFLKIGNDYVDVDYMCMFLT